MFGFHISNTKQWTQFPVPGQVFRIAAANLKGQKLFVAYFYIGPFLLYQDYEIQFPTKASRR